MKRVALPVANDQALLTAFTTLQQSAAAVAIAPLAAGVQARYDAYVACGGNPWLLPLDDTFEHLQESFNGTYKEELVPFNFIAALRSGYDGACPVCGGSGTGTLDHYLPKRHYPEFAFFSRNLVRACYRCNVRKRTLYRGDAADQRPIHPYFDAIPDTRILSVKVVAPFEAPAFEATTLNVPALLSDAVQWHISNVIVPAGFLELCQHSWSRIVLKPSEFLVAAHDRASARTEFERLASQSSFIEGSQNSWLSCFYDGVSRNDDALDYLLALPRT